MPSRNTIREYDAPAYYHVYNRGAGGQYIFRDAKDKWKFLSLLERYLSDNKIYDDYATYPVELVTYCVMGNHFHLLLFQPSDPMAITNLMRSVSTAYSMYHNFRHKTQGHVFQSVFKASRITNESYLMHITRYIHLNPETYRTYKWSSLSMFTTPHTASWVHPERVLDMSPAKYLVFLEDYIDRRNLLKEIKDQMATWK